MKRALSPPPVETPPGPGSAPPPPPFSNTTTTTICGDFALLPPGTDLLLADFMGKSQYLYCLACAHRGLGRYVTFVQHLKCGILASKACAPGSPAVEATCCPGSPTSISTTTGKTKNLEPLAVLQACCHKASFLPLKAWIFPGCAWRMLSSRQR